MKKFCTLLILLFPLTAFGQSESKVLEDSPANLDEPSINSRPDLPTKVILEFPVLDLPYNSANDGRFPSMEQSLAMTKDTYYLTHRGLQTFLRPYSSGFKGFGSRLLIALTDAMTSSLPLADAWLHEEWHRAVMANRNIDSHNGVYAMSGGSVIPVDEVKDEDLIRLKRDHPADQIRLGAAGMESEHELVLSIEKDHFFRNATTWDYGVLWLAKIGPAGYLSTCASMDSITETSKMNEVEDKIPARDFTGLDCNGWVYDLFRPDEPYESRGIHPLGNGIDRYRDLSDLTAKESAYLRKQTKLTLFNFVDPFLVGINGFAFAPGWMGIQKWSFNMRHDLTSFGHTVDANFFFQGQNQGWFTSLHLYNNNERVFPGLEIQRQASDLEAWATTYRVMIWEQPSKQSFFATTGTVGGLASIRMNGQAWGSLMPFAELEAKSEGWVTGVVNIDAAMNGRIGIRTHSLIP